MMAYYKNMINGYIVSYGIGNRGIAISRDEYEAIQNAASSAPTAPEGYEYRLRASDLEWELVELPPEPEPDLTDEEALSILLGGEPNV